MTNNNIVQDSINRNANSAAHSLAKLGLRFEEDEIWLVDWPFGRSISTPL